MIFYLTIEKLLFYPNGLNFSILFPLNSIILPFNYYYNILIIPLKALLWQQILSHSMPCKKRAGYVLLHTLLFITILSKWHFYKQRLSLGLLLDFLSYTASKSACQRYLLYPSLYLCTLAPAPPIMASTSFLLAIVVSPGVVIASAPWAAP